MAIIKNLTDTEYNKLEGLRATVLKEFAKSPLHAKYAMENPKKPTADMILGRQLHSYLLEAHQFKQRAILLKLQRYKRSKAEKRLWAWMCNKFGEDFIVQPSDQKQLVDMRLSALNNPAVAMVLKSVSDVELSLTWEESEVLCKARLDAYSKQLGAIIDIKTCQDASPQGFAKTIYNFGYHLQAIHYLTGATFNDLKADKFIFIAIEKNPPYASAVYLLNIETLTTAGTLRDELLNDYRVCLKSNIWQGYSNEIEQISIPEWASRQIEKDFNGEQNYE